MIAVTLLDIFARESGKGDSARQAARLAARFVDSALADWRRVQECEREVGSTRFAEVAIESAANRSLYEAYRQWTVAAEQVLIRTRELAAAGFPVENADLLEDEYARAQARLGLTPEMAERAAEQVRQNRGVPLGELRHELRARVRA